MIKYLQYDIPLSLILQTCLMFYLCKYSNKGIKGENLQQLYKTIDCKIK